MGFAGARHPLDYLDAAPRLDAAQFAVRLAGIERRVGSCVIELAEKFVLIVVDVED
jgi:hypothetical protein